MQKPGESEEAMEKRMARNQKKRANAKMRGHKSHRDVIRRERARQTK